MPFCPKCRYEYESGREICPDCNSKLVDALPDEETDHTEDLELVEIYSLPGEAYGEMVREVLEKEGIPCMIKTDALSSGYLAKGAGIAGSQAKIYVKKEHASKATRILHDMMDHI